METKMKAHLEIPLRLWFALCMVYGPGPAASDKAQAGRPAPKLLVSAAARS
jgi:hypothetical protein